MQASLRHPNIVPVHHAFAAAGDLVMVMELAEGDPLDRRWSGGGSCLTRAGRLSAPNPACQRARLRRVNALRSRGRQGAVPTTG